LAQEILLSSAELPALRRLDRAPERLLYETRPGLGALPSGLGISLLIIAPQLLSLGFLFWAIWWPTPIRHHDVVRAWICTYVVIGSILLVGWLLARRFRGFVIAVIRAPFIRIRVTDRRVQWLVPWSRQPLIEIGRHRIIGGLLGSVDRHGRGNAAMILVDGDPAADIDGNIHFDRLPNAVKFVDSLSL
jgi:hypothetical protein